jgi:hypothetical protein
MSPSFSGFSFGMPWQTVDLVGRDARLYMLDQHVEAFGHQLSGLAHARKGLRAVKLDLPGLA